MSSDAEIAHTQTYINTEYMQTDDTKAAGDNNNNHKAFFKERKDLDMLI